jgi:hypothetical protein
MLRKRRCGSGRNESRTWQLTQLSGRRRGRGRSRPARRNHEALETDWRTLYRFISHPSLVRALNPMAPRRKCNVCGSQQWHKEPVTGLVVCSEGHVLQVYESSSGHPRPSNDPGIVISQNYLNETYETYEHGALQGRRRTLKSTREKRERTSKANPERTHISPFFPQKSDDIPIR